MGWRSRVQINTVALTVATILGLFALGFAGFAIYQALLPYYPPSMAAVITAAGYAVAAIFVMLIAKFAVYQTKKANNVSQPKVADMDDLENLLQTVITPAISKVVRQHPGKSVITTLLAGLVVGYNNETRSAVRNVIKGFFEDN